MPLCSTCLFLLYATLFHWCHVQDASHPFSDCLTSMRLQEFLHNDNAQCGLQEFNSVEAIKGAVQHGLGAAFVSAAAIKKELQLGLLCK